MLLPGEIDLTRHAPQSGCSPEAARNYTRWLATHHYENFNVVSWLLPKNLHQHFYNVYAYCMKESPRIRFSLRCARPSSPTTFPNSPSPTS